MSGTGWFVISVACVAIVLIGNELLFERKHRKRRHGKPRKPGTELAVRRVPFGDMLPPAPDPDYRDDHEVEFWGYRERPVIRTAQVQGVHLPLSDGSEAGARPVNPWAPPAFRPDTPRPGERPGNSGAVGAAATGSGPGGFHATSRNMNHNLPDTIIDSPPRIRRELARPGARIPCATEPSDWLDELLGNLPGWYSRPLAAR